MNEQLVQVVRFLFVPEAALSMFFFVIFVLILVFGVITYRRNRNRLIDFREGASEEYSKISQKTPPEMFLKRGLERLSAGDGILEGIPDVFVSVGILATFIGLGIAIQEAAGLLIAEKFEMEKMIGLLGIIAFKFQTSVWGIAFSLIFRRFGVENYFSFRQEVIDEIRELLYAMERDSVQRLLEKQNDFLETMLHYQQKADKDLDSHLEVLSKEINAQQESLLTRQLEKETARHGELLTAVKSLEDIQRAGMNGVKEEFGILFARQLEKETARHGELLAAVKSLEDVQRAGMNGVKEEFGILWQRFDAFEGIAGDYVQTAKNFEELVAAFVGQVGNFRQDVITMQENIATVLNEINDKTQDNLVRMHSHVENLQKVFLRDENQYVAETRESFRNVLKDSEDAFKNILNESISNVHESYVRELENFDDVGKGLKKVLAQIDSRVSKMENMSKISCQDLNSMMEAVKTSTENYQKNLIVVHNEMSNAVKETSKLQSGLLETQEKMLAQNFVALQDKMSNAVKETSKLQSGLFEKQEKMLAQNLAAVQDKMSNAMKETSKLQSGLLETQGEMLVQNLAAVQDKMSNAMKETSKLQSGLLETQGEMLAQNLEAVHDELSNAVKETSKLQSGLLEKQEKMLSEFSMLFTQNIKSVQDAQANLRDGMALAISILDKDIKNVFGDMQKTMVDCSDMRPVNESLQEFREDVLRLADVYSQRTSELQAELPVQLANVLRGELLVGEVIAALETLNKKQDDAIALESKLNDHAEQMLACLKQSAERADSQEAQSKEISTQSEKIPGMFGIVNSFFPAGGDKP